jgi:F-type H+-transporting ATPase subunit delta
MESASREALANARDRLGALTDDPQRRVALAADLRAAGVLLAREPGLRRVLADASTRERSRVGLLDALLGERVGPDALEVLRSVVSQRWSSPSDLIDGVELLAVDAELADAAGEGILGDVEDELFRFRRIVEGTPRLGAILEDPTADPARRAQLVRSLLEGRAKPVTLRLAQMAVYGLGGRNVDGSLERLAELAAARRDREVAYVRAAAPLSAEQEQRLTARLSAIYGRDMSLLVEVDRSLIGGAVIRVGDDLYDGSYARRLDQARNELA